MNKYLFSILLYCLLLSCSKPKEDSPSILNVASGKIERIEQFPSQFIAARNIDIWLPKGYNKKEKYAVLYMHDGQMLFDTAITWNRQEWGVDEVLSNLIQTQKIKKCIVVGIWNSGKSRHADYFPQKPFEMLHAGFQDSLIRLGKRNEGTALFSTKVQSDSYLKFITTELKPFIDKKYACYTDRKNTFIAGSSMGGLISMYALCEYPDIFGGAACLSTHWIGTFQKNNNPIPATFFKYLTNNLPEPAHHKIYFDYGTETLDALYEQAQIQVDAIMQAKGYSAEQWITRKFVGADHSERSWRKRLDIPMSFLLAK